MSLINDALKRAQQAQARQRPIPSPDSPLQAVSEARGQRKRTPAWTRAGVLALALVVLGTVALGRRHFRGTSDSARVSSSKKQSPAFTSAPSLEQAAGASLVSISNPRVVKLEPAIQRIADVRSPAATVHSA